MTSHYVSDLSLGLDDLMTMNLTVESIVTFCRVWRISFRTLLIGLKRSRDVFPLVNLVCSLPWLGDFEGFPPDVTALVTYYLS